MSTYGTAELMLEEDTQKGKYLTFALGNEHYAIEIKHVTEIIGMQPISEIPEMPTYVKGIINLRGKIIPVMDVRLRFKKAEVAYNDRTCVIVIEVSNVSVGLIVDRVSEVLSIPDTDIVPPPDAVLGGDRFIIGIGKIGDEVKMLLNCDMLIHDKGLDEALVQTNREE